MFLLLFQPAIVPSLAVSIWLVFSVFGLTQSVRKARRLNFWLH
jgi:hypothetical protein